jgi:hypothetical protein
MMASTPDELVAGFPQTSIPKVRREQTCEDLKIIIWLLNTTAMRVSSHEGGWRYGHLGLIMTTAKCFAVASDVLPPPTNQGSVATIVVGMTADHIIETNRLHTEATRVYRTYHTVDQAFTKMIIDAFEDPYLNALSNEIVGYANCT